MMGSKAAYADGVSGGARASFGWDLERSVRRRANYPLPLRGVYPPRTYQNILHPVRNLFESPDVRASASLSFAFHPTCLFAHRLPCLLDDSDSASQAELPP